MARASFGIVSLVFVFVVVCFSGSRSLPAGLPRHLTDFQVIIDGVDYGVFDRIGGFGRLARGRQHRITLERDFVAHPSLSLWAGRQLARRQMLRDIALVVPDQNGIEKRYVLRYCQPLSWSVGAVNSAFGGYHETIDLAVREVSSL